MSWAGASASWPNRTDPGGLDALRAEIANLRDENAQLRERVARNLGEQRSRR